MGDCYVLATLGALAQQPQRLKSLFGEKYITPDGKYTVPWVFSNWKSEKGAFCGAFISGNECPELMGMTLPNFLKPFFAWCWLLNGPFEILEVESEKSFGASLIG